MAILSLVRFPRLMYSAPLITNHIANSTKYIEMLVTASGSEAVQKILLKPNNILDCFENQRFSRNDNKLVETCV